MKEEKFNLEDLKEIKGLMERSVKFLSLSGLASIIIGFIALTGVFSTLIFLDQSPLQASLIPWGETINGISVNQFIYLNATNILVLSLAIAAAFAIKNQRKAKEPIWNKVSQNLLFNLFTPLFTGGILCLIFINQGLEIYLAGTSLLFYGLGIIGISKYSFDELKYFGLIQTLLGLTALYYLEYSVQIWALGFGLLHIIYGLRIFKNFESK